LARKKALLSAAVLTVAVGLVAGTTVAEAGGGKKGDTLRLSALSTFDYVDPALTYYSSGWQLEYSTCVKLVNYPDGGKPAVVSSLIPEAAAALPVISKDGKTYNFTIRKGFKFSPPSNQPLTAKNFKFIIERLADPNMNSPAGPFLSNIAGAQDKLDGKANAVNGVTAKGNKLTIKLIQPDASFLAQLAMPFYCSLPTNTPNDPKGVTTPAAAGPYYIKEFKAGESGSVVLVKNPNYSGNRPRNWNKIQWKIGVSDEAKLLQIKAGQADYAVDGVPPAEYQKLWAEVGPTSKAGKSGKQQFFVNKELGVRYLAMNNDRPLIKGNANLRKAINFAIDRPNLVRQAGAYGNSATDQILPPGMPGYKDIDAYPIKAPDLNKAKALVPNLNATAVLYTSTSATASAQAQVIQDNLKKIGLNVEIKQFSRGVQITKEGTRGEPFDITSEAWVADYNDPFDFINVLLDGDNLQEANNNNIAYFNDAAYNAKMDAAAKSTGAARIAAYQQLDADLTLKAVPWAAWGNINNREVFSARIGCHQYIPAYAGMNLGALCLR
jgi:peptide/nickel transport system substrate-binding protein